MPFINALVFLRSIQRILDVKMRITATSDDPIFWYDYIY